jgi:phosphoribosylanthranilate isomerase
MEIKVCGMRDTENIKSVLSLNPNYMGFLFYEGSPRYVGKNFSLEGISFAETKKIGVFVNESLENVEVLIEQHQLDGVQLHGNESPEYCQHLKEKTMVIKSISIGDSIDKAYLKTLETHCHYFLFDTKTEAFGGSGKKFNWTLLEQIAHPFFLSGGISNAVLEKENLPKNKYLRVLDLNSQYEIQAGIKDLEKLKIVFKNKNNGNSRRH